MEGSRWRPNGTASSRTRPRRWESSSLREAVQERGELCAANLCGPRIGSVQFSRVRHQHHLVAACDGTKLHILNSCPAPSNLTYHFGIAPPYSRPLSLFEHARCPCIVSDADTSQKIKKGAHIKDQASRTHFRAPSLLLWPSVHE